MVSLFISYYAELEVVRSTTEKYMTQYISYADQDFNDMLNEAKKISLSVAVDRSIIYPALMSRTEEVSFEGYQQRQQVRSYLSGLITQKEYVKNVMVITDQHDIYQAASDLMMKQDLKDSLIQAALKTERMELLFDRGQGKALLAGPFYIKTGKKAVCIVQLDYYELSSAYEQEPLGEVEIFIFEHDSQLFFANNLKT